MLLSLEIPIPHLKEFLPLTDFGFGLAHLCIVERPEYGRLMKGCLLDNSMYELGESLSVKDLVRAAKLVNPVAVIAPDWENEKSKTIRGVEELYNAVSGLDPGWTVGALVQGRDLVERLNCFCLLKRMGCSPIGFPFRSPRGETIGRLHIDKMFDKDGWYHLFGLRSMDELSLKLPGKWSIDTGKPFKGFRIDQGSIRGHGKLRLHESLTEKAYKAALWNIAYMRKEMQ